MQACAIESAARNSPTLSVLVVLTSDKLDLSASNSTCHLYLRYKDRGNVHFRTVGDKSEFFADTPIDASVRARIAASDTAVVHWSDAIRLVLVSKLGGWYSDLDMVILQDLAALPANCLSSDQATDSDLKQHPDNWGAGVSNAIFHFGR